MFKANISKSLTTIAIDSCKLRIPLSKVKILNTDLSSYYAELNLGSGEIDETTMKRRAFAVEEKGIKTRYLIERKSGATFCEYLAILCNSKLLKKNYLKGITKNTVNELHEAICAHNVVDIAFSDFLKAFLSDTDIKFDFVIDNPKVRDFLFDYLKSATALSQLKRGGVDYKKQKSNFGVQWGKRDVANISHPHIKIYAKDIEMKHNDSTVLFVKSFNIDVTTGLTRLEGTVKNRKHWNSFFPEKEFSLEEVLALPTSTLYKIITKMLDRHLNDTFIMSEEEQEDREGLSEKEQITIHALKLFEAYSKLSNQHNKTCNYSTATPLTATQYLSSHCDKSERGRKAKSRIKKLVNELWFKYVRPLSKQDKELIAKRAAQLTNEDDKVTLSKKIDAHIALLRGNYEDALALEKQIKKT